MGGLHVPLTSFRTFLELEQLNAKLQYGWVIFNQRNNLRNVPEWIRRTIRLSICLVLFGLLGHSTDDEMETGTWQTELLQSSNWAALTCIVVSAPYIGQVSEVSTLRIMGTIIGALWGYMMIEIGLESLSPYGSGVFVSMASPFMVAATTYLACKKGQNQLAKFTQLTYVIVGYGAKPQLGRYDAVMRTVMRTVGIIAGGLVSVLVSVLVLPRSATVEALRETKKVLGMLVDLNEEVWKNTSVPMTGNTTLLQTSKSHNRSFRKLMSMMSTKVEEPEQARVRPSAESLMNKLQTSLSKIDDTMEQCRGEIYVHHLKGRYLFMPGIHFFQLGRWHLPYEDLHNLTTSIRHIVRLLWTLLDFELGLDDNIGGILREYYPKELMSELAVYMHRSLSELHLTFPNSRMIPVDNLLTLGQVVDCLIQIGEARNRQEVIAKQRHGTARPPAAAAAAGTSPGQNRSPAPGMEAQHMTPPGLRRASISSGMMPRRRSMQSSFPGHVAIRIPPASPNTMQIDQLQPAAAGYMDSDKLESQPLLLVPETEIPALGLPVSAVPVASAAHGPDMAWSSDISAHPLSATSNLPAATAMDPPAATAMAPPAAASATWGVAKQAHAESSPFTSMSLVEVDCLGTSPQSLQKVPSDISTEVEEVAETVHLLRDMPVSSSMVQRSHVPLASRHYSLDVGSSAADDLLSRRSQAGFLKDGFRVSSAGDNSAADAIRRRTSAQLEQLMASASVEPIVFPPTEKGYLSKVRWYSFQFVMDELIQELGKAYLAATAVLEKLPHPIP